MLNLPGFLPQSHPRAWFPCRTAMQSLGTTSAELPVARAKLEFALRKQYHFKVIISFYLGGSGPWRVTHRKALRRAGLAPANRIAVVEMSGELQTVGAWCLRRFGSNHRYATRAELDVLGARQAGLGRPEATCAALIPIRKGEAWWRMAQDERLAMFGERSGHSKIGLDYLPGVVRRLLHCRDLGEPFDFLTWVEFAPAQTPAFDELLRRLRVTEEWSLVEREVEIRLERLPA